MKASTYIDLDSSISPSVSSSSHDTSEYVKVRNEISEDKNRVDPRVLANDFIAHYRRVLQRFLVYTREHVSVNTDGVMKVLSETADFSLIQDPEFENIDWD
jgi:hypothetical protein